jgi:putative ABC transport system permease protein
VYFDWIGRPDAHITGRQMTLAADVRHAVRHLLRSPGYTATTVVTFVLAIGANSAIFSAVNTVLLRPLPVAAPDRLAVVWQTDGGGQAVVELTHRHLREWQSSGGTFTHASLMGSHNWSAVLEGRGEPSRIWFSGVSADFFETLGIRPLVGRALQPDDDVPNAPAVAVLNHGAWVRRFGGDPAVVGTRLMLDGSPVEIVGVMPPGLDYPQGAELWVPVVPVLASGTPPSTTALDTVGVFYVLGRVRPGLEVSRAASEIDAIERRLDASTPGRLKWGERAVVTPFLDHVFGPVRPALRVLWAAVGVLLLIACANVSGLMMTRVSRRRHEHAIRLALGASRAAIGRLWLIEILLIAIVSGALGLVVASWTARAIVALAPDDLPRVSEIAIDPAVAVFTFATVLAVALVTGAFPLRQAGAGGVLGLQEGERTTAGRRSLRARSTLLVVQVALSVVLLVAAGLVFRSFVALRRVDLGFSPDRVLSLTVQPQSAARPPNVWLDELVARIQGLPGVEAAGTVYLRPLMLGPIGQGVQVFLEGQPETREAAEANPTLNHQIASPGYFHTMKIPLRAGRLFTREDRARTPRVAIVSESTARRLWPGQDPIGRRLLMSSFTPGEPRRAWRTVVGVVSDVRYRGLRDVQLDVYDAALQIGRPADNVVVRTSGDPGALAADVRATARELDPAAIVDSVTTMEAVVQRAEAPWRLATWMFVLFGVLAFALSALGLFSLVALDVAHRAREFAIRLALGATGAAVVRGVLLRAVWRVAWGLALGMAGAFAASRALRGLLFGVAPDDGATYAAVLGLVLAAVTVAAWVPASRAARSNPQMLLRE